MGPTQVFVSGNNSMGGSLNSLATLKPSMSLINYSISWTGTSPVGTITVESSNDYEVDFAGAVRNAGSWNTLPFTNSAGAIVTSVAVSGNTGKGMININGIGANAIRLVYTRTSGTGTLSSFINGMTV
jgi:hypothetical protein